MPALWCEHNMTAVDVEAEIVVEVEVEIEVEVEDQISRRLDQI